MIEFDERSPIINETPAPHHCFGCGRLNPIGLCLQFRRAGDTVWAAFTPSHDHEGYLGMTHGGILSTLLDEAMSWAITDQGDFGVTARMTVDFRKPVAVGQDVRVVGWVVNQRGRLIDAEAEILDAGSRIVLAKAEGRFLRVSDQQAAAWRAQYLASPGGSTVSGRS